MLLGIIIVLLYLLYISGVRVSEKGRDEKCVQLWIINNAENNAAYKHIKEENKQDFFFFWVMLNCARLFGCLFEVILDIHTDNHQWVQKRKKKEMLS